MDPYLVGAASLWPHPEEAAVGEPCDNPPMSNRRPRAPGSGGDPLPVPGIPAQWMLNGSPHLADPSMDEGQVVFPHLALTELASEFPMGLLCLGHYHDP